MATKAFPFFSEPIPNFSDRAKDIGVAHEIRCAPELSGDVGLRLGLAEGWFYSKENSRAINIAANRLLTGA